MRRVYRVHVGWLIGAALLVSCSSPSEPVLPGGSIVLRFESTPPSLARAGASAPSAVAAPIDSVAVRVFRGGGVIVLETVAGAPVLGPDPIELTIPCIAEAGKRVSVEVFEAGVMSHHGVDTDVDVSAGKTTAVNIDAYPFAIAALSVTPESVPEGAAFSLAWSSATAAAWYRVQSSATPEFTDVEWEQTVTDTVLDTQRAPGTHYFRVIPSTQFASGTPAGPEFGYVIGGSGVIDVTAFNPGAAIPNETFTIVGENLDYPGTRAWIGVEPLPIETASWGALTVRLPRNATTSDVIVVSGASGLGSDTSTDPFIAQRVAYVTDGGKYAFEYIETLMKYTDDFGNSGVVEVPVEELDWRDMNVFDTIIVAGDTGAFPASWGGGVPARAAEIAFSPANVLAIGKGGAVFLQLVTSAADVPHDPRVDADGVYYAPNANARIFTTPHPVPGPDVAFCLNPAAATLALDITSAPAGVSLYASTDKNCFLGCQPNNRWALADFRFLNPVSTPVVYFYWGYDDDPKALSKQGLDCLANVMYMLYTDRP